MYHNVILKRKVALRLFICLVFRNRIAHTWDVNFSIPQQTPLSKDNILNVGWMLFTCCIELGYFTSMVSVIVCRDNYDDILLVILVILYTDKLWYVTLSPSIWICDIDACLQWKHFYITNEHVARCYWMAIYTLYDSSWPVLKYDLIPLRGITLWGKIWCSFQSFVCNFAYYFVLNRIFITGTRRSIPSSQWSHTAPSLWLTWERRHLNVCSITNKLHAAACQRN